MSHIERILAELGHELPEAPKPVAAYIPAIRTGNLIYTSGQLPMKDGALTVKGIVGADVSLDEAVAAARLSALNALAAIKGVAGGLDSIVRVVKVNVFVASTPDFTDQPKVANGASEFIQQVFGDKGKHARAAVGCPSLPLNAPVEVELIVELSD